MEYYLIITNRSYIKLNKTRFLILLMLSCFLLTSCVKQGAGNNNGFKDKDVIQTARVIKEYEAEKIKSDFDVLAGISNEIIYGINYDTYYSVYYADVNSPEIRNTFLSDLAGISCLKERNDKLYVYGYNNNGSYKIYTYSEDMQIISEIADEDKQCRQIAPLQDGRIIAYCLDGLRSYLTMFSADGEVLNETYPEVFNIGGSLWIDDVIATDDDNILMLGKYNDEFHIYIFSAELELLDDIYFDCDYAENFWFSDCDGKIYLNRNSFDEAATEFYMINESDFSVEYVTSLISVDYTLPGSGDYDYLYAKNDEIYGFQIDGEKSDRILENISDDNLYNFFTCSDGLCYCTNDNKHTEQIAKSDSGKKKNVYKLVESDLFGCERLSYRDHFQALRYADNSYEAYDISLSTNEAEIISLDMDDSMYVIDALISSTNVYVDLMDDTETGYIRCFDRKGKEVYEYESAGNIEDFSVMSDGGLFLIETDVVTGEFIFSLLHGEEAKPVRLTLSGLPDEEIIAACFPSQEDNTVLLMSENYLYSGKINENDIELEALVSLKSLNVSLEFGINNFFYEEAQMYIVSGNEIYKLIIRDNTDAENKQEKKKLDVVYINCLPDNWVNEQFEKNNPDFEVVPYLFSSSEEDFTEKLNLMLVSDDTVDVVVMKDEGQCDYSIVRDNYKGIYADLYRFMDSESDDYHADDFRQNILSALEYKGALFQMVPYFTVRTIIGEESDNQISDNWSVEDFTSHLRNNPDSAFFRNDIEIVSKTALNLMPFYNYEKDECFFDTDKFRNLIETVNGFPESAGIVSDFDLYDIELNNYNQINEAEHAYFKGNSVKNIGFPDVTGNGAMIVPDIQLSIMDNRVTEDTAWEFIKYYLSEEYFDQHYAENRQFPIVNALSEKLKNITQNITEDSEFLSLNACDFNKNPVKLNAPDKKYTDAVDEIINGASVIYRYDFRIDSIFYDEYFEYTEGEQSLSDMSKDIQKKVQIYLGERS